MVRCYLCQRENICNLYSHTKPEDAARNLARVERDIAGNSLTINPGIGRRRTGRIKSRELGGRCQHS